MKGNIKVHQFDTAIYPRLIWITTSSNSHFDGFEELPIMDETIEASVDHIRNIALDRGGVFIRFDGKKAMTTSSIAHESVHAAIEIFNYIGARIEIDNQEPFAYLVGFISDCCEQVKNNKFKD